jgi:hypothetical protein
VSDAPEPYDWCDECDIPVDADRHEHWHQAGGRPRTDRPKRVRDNFRRSGARSVIRQK